MPTNGETNEQVVQVSRASWKHSFLFIDKQKDGHIEWDKAQMSNGGVSGKVRICQDLRFSLLVSEVIIE